MHVEGTPPCVKPGTKLNACAAAVHDWMVRAVGPLPGPWKGWRLAGRHLVTPEGVRLTPERIRGLAWKQDAEARLEASRARNAAAPQLVRVVVIDLGEYRTNGIAAA